MLVLGSRPIWRCPLSACVCMHKDLLVFHIVIILFQLKQWINVCFFGVISLSNLSNTSMLYWCIPLQKTVQVKTYLLIILALHLSAEGIFRSMYIVRAINVSMPNFLQYFFCYLGDRSSTAVACWGLSKHWAWVLDWYSWQPEVILFFLLWSIFNL
jgi:hypothetical protein